MPPGRTDQPPPCSRVGRLREIASDHADCLLGVREMWDVAGGLHQVQRGRRQVLEEVLPDALRVGGTEALLRFRDILRCVVSADDDWGQRSGPAEIVLLHHVEQTEQIRALKASPIGSVIQIAGNGADEHQTGKPGRLTNGGSIPTVALTECPTKMTSGKSSAAHTSSTSLA